MVWTTKPLLGTQLDWTNPLNQGLAGFWVFNEGMGDKVNDLSGNANTGTLTNMAFPSTTTSGWNPGRLGPAIAFDGVNDYVDVGNAASLNFGSGEFAVETWVKILTNDNDWHNIISKKQNYNDYHIGWMVHLDFRVTGAMQLRINDGTQTNDDTLTASGDLKTTIQDGNWHHLVWVVNADNTVTYYLDGLNKGSQSFSMSGSLSNPVSLRINTGQESNKGINSIIDEVRIYNRALSDSEIMELYINPYGMFLEECPAILCTFNII